MYVYRAPPKEEMMYVQEPEEQVTYVTGMYLDGDQMSNLTILKQQDPNNMMYMNGQGYTSPGSNLQTYMWIVTWGI